MIAKMKKINFLVYHKEYDIFLKDLKALGLIHVASQDKKVEDDGQLDTFLKQSKKLQAAEKELTKFIDNKAKNQFNEIDASQGLQIPKILEAIKKEKAELQQKLQIAQKERDTILPWGSFNPEDLQKLKKAGYTITLFSVQRSAYKSEWEAQHNAIVINNDAGRTHFITITNNEHVASALSLESVKLPELSLEKLNALIESLQTNITEQDKKIAALAANIPSLQAAQKVLESEIDYKHVVLNTRQIVDEKLMMLQGWTPAKHAKKVQEYLHAKSLYFDVSDPTPDDSVPIQFSNNKFTKLFEPIAEMYMLPKYNEMDLTPYFAPFYMIFFGLSLGDIGYGLFLFLAATAFRLWKRKSLEKSIKSALTLVQTLGISAFFCGLLTGGFFGYQIYDIHNSFFQNLKEKIFLDNNQMFLLSLLLGVVQIMFGMIFKAINRAIQFGFQYALSTIGWFVLLLSIIIAYLLPKTMPMFATTHLIVMGLCSILIFFFNSPGKNLLLNFGLGLWDSYNMATGLLGDILSYVRLFALGLSGSILASVFNSLAAGMKPDNAVLGPIVFILIFVIGHAITIFMNTLGAIVHPMRLTFVEFYKNAGFEGGGKAYKPFENKIINNKNSN